MSHVRFAIPFLFCIYFSIDSAFLYAQEFRVERSTIESWIFQRQNGFGNAQKSLSAQVDLKIASMSADVALTPEQIAMLKLAAEGDVKRFYDEVETIVAKAEELENNQNAVNEAYQMTLPLQQKLAGGLFKDDSLMQKVLRGILSSEQLAELEHAESKRKYTLVSAYVRSFLAQMDQSVPMTADQLEQLTQLLIEATQRDNMEGEFGQYVVAYRLTKISREDLSKFMRKEQLDALRAINKQMDGIEGFLKQRGMLRDDN